MILVGVSLTDVNDRTADSVEQDQTARMCSLILLYTLRKITFVMANCRIMVE